MARSDSEWDDAHLLNELVDLHADDPEFGYRFLHDERRKTAQQARYSLLQACRSLHQEGTAAVTQPVTTWSTGAGDAAVDGRTAASVCPAASFAQRILSADYANGWIRLLPTDGAGWPTGAPMSFSSTVDSPVELCSGPAGDLYYLAISAGELLRITPDSTPPNPQAGTCYLSDATPVGPTANGWGPFETDQSNGDSAAADGTILRLNGVPFTKGLGVHSPSSSESTVEPNCQLDAVIGVDDEVGERGIQSRGHSGRTFQLGPHDRSRCRSAHQCSTRRHDCAPNGGR